MKLKKNETIIAQSTKYRRDANWFSRAFTNDAFYDLYLAEISGNNYILIIFMKIQFIFEDDPKRKWNLKEKKIFAMRFAHSINAVWGNNKIIKRLENGKHVYLDFRFETLIGGFCLNENWEINVKKLPKGVVFLRSQVEMTNGTASLDSGDFKSMLKKSVGKVNYTQRGAVHEFGHMLDLGDEYEVGSYTRDFGSIMNAGEKIRDRHNLEYLEWVEKVLKEKNIK